MGIILRRARIEDKARALEVEAKSKRFWPKVSERDV